MIIRKKFFILCTEMISPEDYISKIWKLNICYKKSYKHLKSIFNTLKMFKVFQPICKRIEMQWFRLEAMIIQKLDQKAKVYYKNSIFEWEIIVLKLKFLKKNI